MFTGLVDAVGTIERVTETDAGREFRVRADYDDLTDGESIAVNGACLTVRDRADGRFTVAAVVTTLGRTTMADWLEGKRVNLERALKASDRLGGHIVQGHVDTRGTFLGAIDEGEFWTVHIGFPPEVSRYMVEKGSIAVEGISLTIAHLNDDHFDIAIIPKTWEVTNLSSLKPGDPVNLEVDVIAKYVERMMAGRTAS